MSKPLGSIFAVRSSWDKTDEEAIRGGGMEGEGQLGEICKEIRKLVVAEKDCSWCGYSGNWGGKVEKIRLRLYNLLKKIEKERGGYEG